MEGEYQKLSTVVFVASVVVTVSAAVNGWLTGVVAGVGMTICVLIMEMVEALEGTFVERES